MILNVSTKNGSIVVDRNLITAVIEEQNCYSTPLILKIGVEVDYVELDIGSDYKILYETWTEVTLKYLKSEVDFIGNRKINYMYFVHSDFFNILSNIVPLNSMVDNVKFEKYINGLSKQLEYFIFEIRKKGVVLTIDNSKDFYTKHITEMIFNKECKELSEVISIKSIYSNANKKNSYYSIDMSKIKVTKNTKNFNSFIPFSKEDEIIGLSTYLIEKYEVYSDDILSMNIGDMFKVNDEKCVVMNKNTFWYLGATKSNSILGVSSNA